MSGEEPTSAELAVYRAVSTAAFVKASPDNVQYGRVLGNFCEILGIDPGTFTGIDHTVVDSLDDISDDIIGLINAMQHRMMVIILKHTDLVSDRSKHSVEEQENIDTAYGLITELCKERSVEMKRREIVEDLIRSKIDSLDVSAIEDGGVNVLKLDEETMEKIRNASGDITGEIDELINPDK